MQATILSAREWVEDMVVRFLWGSKEIAASEWSSGPAGRDTILRIDYGLQARITSEGNIMFGGVSAAERQVA